MHEDIPEEAVADLANRALALLGIAVGLMLLSHHVDALGAPAYLDTTLTAVALWIHFGAGCLLASGLLLFEFRADRGSPIQRENRAVAYSIWMLAYEAHEWTHFLSGVLLGADARRVRGDDGRPGTAVRWPSSAPEWRRVTVDVSPCVIGLATLAYLSPWLLAAFLNPEVALGPSQLTIVDGVARILVGAQLVIYAWPSLEDLRGLASFLGLVDGRATVRADQSRSD